MDPDVCLAESVGLVMVWLAAAYGFTVGLSLPTGAYFFSHSVEENCFGRFALALTGATCLHRGFGVGQETAPGSKSPPVSAQIPKNFGYRRTPKQFAH